MMKHCSELEPLMGPLCRLLEAELRRIDTALEHLDALRAGVIKRDEASLAHLLETIRLAQDEARGLERQREDMQRRLAQRLGCSCEQMNLTRLVDRLDGEPKQRVAELQQRLQKAVRRLRAEHQATVLLLNDCARFTRRLLHGLLGRSSQGVTYTERGESNRHTASGLMSVRL